MEGGFKIMQSRIKKFEEILDYYNVSETTLKDVARAICMADILYGTNDKRLSIQRLEVSGVVQFQGLSLGVGKVHKSLIPLPDVQIMRVMCDVLYYCLLFKGKVIPDTHLTSGASNMVGKGSIVDKGISEPAKSDYCDFDECTRVLDVFYNSRVVISADEIAKINEFIKFVTDNFKNKCKFDGLVIDKVYKPYLRGSYFFNNITFKYTGRHFLDDVALYLIQYYLKYPEDFELALEVAIKSKHYKTKKDLVLPSDLLQKLRGRTIIYNSLKPCFEFSTNSKQGLNSVLLLYTLLFATILETKAFDGGIFYE